MIMNCWKEERYAMEKTHKYSLKLIILFVLLSSFLANSVIVYAQNKEEEDYFQFDWEITRQERRPGGPFKSYTYYMDLTHNFAVYIRHRDSYTTRSGAFDEMATYQLYKITCSDDMYRLVDVNGKEEGIHFKLEEKKSFLKTEIVPVLYTENGEKLNRIWEVKKVFFNRLLYLDLIDFDEVYKKPEDVLKQFQDDNLG